MGRTFDRVDFNEPAVVREANLFREQVAAQERAALFEMEVAMFQMLDRLEMDMMNLAREMTRQVQAGHPLTPSDLFKLEHYQQVAALAEIELNRYVGQGQQIVQRHALAQFNQGVDHSGRMMHLAAAEFGERVVVTPVNLNRAAIENLVSRNETEAWRGVMRNQGMGVGTRDLDAFGGLLIRELTTGLAAGQNPRDVARRMQSLWGKRVLQRSELIARDQMNRASREGTQQGYQQSAMVTGFRRLAAKNDRTCLACLALDGTVYETDEFMEVHPQDRCTMVPNIRGLPPVQFQTGAEWFEGLPHLDKIKVLGPGRADLYFRGNLDFKDLASVKENALWGPSAVPTPLWKLQGKAGPSIVQPPPESAPGVIGRPTGAPPSENLQPGAAKQFDFPTPEEISTAKREKLGFTGVNDSYFVEVNGEKYFVKKIERYGGHVEQLNTDLGHDDGMGDMFPRGRVQTDGSDTKMVLEFLDDADTLFELGRDRGPALTSIIDRDDQVQRAVLWDWMTGQTDRHAGNVMISKDRSQIFMIDSGTSLGSDPWGTFEGFTSHRAIDIDRAWTDVYYEVLESEINSNFLAEMRDTFRNNMHQLRDAMDDPDNNTYSRTDTDRTMDVVEFRVELLDRMYAEFGEDANITIEQFADMEHALVKDRRDLLFHD